jgi:hypothetical protein
LFGWATVDQPHDPPQFIAYRVLLLRRDNNARMIRRKLIQRRCKAQ